MPATEYDFWLLDLDGTLVDVSPEYPREVFDRVGQRLGRRFTEREAEILWYGFGGERDRRLREWGIDAGRFWDAFHAEEDPLARAEATFLYDDASLVADLDVPVGLITHCQEYLTKPVLDRLDLGDWFDVVVCCDDELGWKPDPAPVERAMSTLGVDRDADGVLIGDSPQDVGAAWNAGLDGIHLSRQDPAERGHCVLADQRVSGFDELLAASVAR